MACGQNRRSFLKRAGLVASALTLGGAGGACSKERKPAGVKTSSSRVAVGQDHGVRKAQNLDGNRISSLLNHTLKDAFGAPDAVTGLRSLLNDGDVVGLKLNCLAGEPLSPTRELVDGLIGILERAGVGKDRIILFERSERDLTKGGFDLRHRAGGLRVIGHDSPGFGYEQEVRSSGMVGSCLSRILTRGIDVLINVGVLKDHNLAGVSAGMKNLFGLIHNPNRYHDDNCDPFVADVLGFPVVRRKLKLTVIDALTAQCQGGPAWMPDFAWRFDGLMASTDPVALDRVAWQLIEAQRKAKSLPSLVEAKRPPKWIATAAARGLGQADPQKFKLLRRG
jgi:uncharacterized protein (DUF362 family)